MKKLLVFLMLSCLIFSCSEDTSLDEFAMEESFINGRVLDDGGIYSDPGDSKPCFEYELLYVDENGCCVYRLIYTPRYAPIAKGPAGLYMQGPRGKLKGDFVDGSYIWDVTICRGGTFRLIFESNEMSTILCSQTISCDPPVDCCDVGFTWEYKEPGEIGCDIYAVALVIPSDECEWRITGVYSKQGSASIIVHEGGTTADITLCEIKNPTGPIGFGFTAENINGDCSTFNSGFINP